MIPFWIIIISIFSLDVLTKTLVRSQMPMGSEISILPFFSLVHVSNTGIAFGMFQGKNLFFLIFGVVAILVFLVWGIKMLKEDKWFAYILAIVTGGAAGNILDRIMYGQVTDFLDFYVGSYHWPSFNVADSAICVGAGLLLWHNFRRSNAS